MPDPHRTPLARLVLLGAAATTFQTLLSRAFLAAFGGNEAVLAALLAAWLAAGALGAALGRGRAGAATAALAAHAPLAAAGLVAARAVPALFPAGAAPGPGAALLWAALLAGPACAAAGVAFAALATAAPDDEGPGTGRIAGRAYVAESIGAAIAGAALSAALLGRVPDLALAAGGALAAALGAALGARRAAAALSLALGAAVAAIVAAPGVAAWTLAVQGAWLAGAEERPSASSWIVVARPSSAADASGGAGREAAVLADRAPVAAGPDRAGAEETAHLVLALHPAPRRVAVVGVPPPGTFAELGRHGASVEALVEDAGLLAALREALPEWRSPAVAARSGDARRLLDAAPGRYDAILVVGPEPTSAAQNRTFTLEFLASARRALAGGGVLAVALPGHAAAASLETRRLHSSVARTLEAAAGPVLVLPAGRTLYLAGRADLPDPRDAAAAISAALAARGIAPVHLGPAALRDLLSGPRTADAARWSSLREPPNRDLRPTTYRLALARTLAQAGDLGAGALALLAVALAAGALLALGPRSRPVEVAVAASGASGLCLQLLLLLAYQIGTGALYRELGLLSAGFMAGAAAGGVAGARRAPARWVISAAAAQAALAVALAAVAPIVARGGPTALPLALGAAALAGFLPGAQFTAAARLLPPGAAATLWGADLAGAAVAAATTFTFAVPALGVRGALVAVAALQAASAALLLAPRRPRAEVRRAPLLPALPLAFAGAVVLAAWDATQLAFSSLATGRTWRLAAVGALVAALAAAAEPAVLDRASRAARAAVARARRAVGLAATRVASFAALVPAAAFPVARCFFQVPFLFCHACPRPCAFGWVRPYAVPAALALNVFDGRFCQRHCPAGTVQSACGLLSGRPPRRLRRAALLRWPVLALVAAGYLAVAGGRDEGVQGAGLYALVFRNAYAPSIGVLAAAALLLLASFRWRRPFCDVLCPIGAASALVRAGEDRLVPLRAAPARPPPGEGSARREAGRG